MSIAGILRGLGVDYAQVYALHRPQSLEDAPRRETPAG